MKGPTTSQTDITKYGPWAVIAGGSEGVGAAFAELLAQAGINLLLVARKPGPLEETAAAARRHGIEARTLAADLTAVEGVQSVIDAVRDVEVGLLILNAGADSNAAPFLDADLAQVSRLLELNVLTPLHLIHHFGHAMRERRRGGILLVGSLAGDLGTSHHAVYGGAKAFGRIFAEGLWLELREYDVHVLDLVLGVTRTPAMQRLGLDFDLPGINVSEPIDVAREGLTHLPHGPIRVAGGNDAGAAFRADPDRAKVVLKSHSLTQRLVGATEEA